MLTIKRLTAREGTVYHFKQPVEIRIRLVMDRENVLLELFLVQPDGQRIVDGVGETQEDALFDLAKSLKLTKWNRWLLENVQVGA
jgi:hypothetical protein